ncbi:hypothetical protein [Streptomyces enissocaesilis]|uniref:Uncharacterized protein n=1 Tax=Streptomyces enissocaesilis TaxID=332589 RepID=A0ABP6JDG9_9ACTN
MTVQSETATPAPPVWWPEVATNAVRRRRFTGLLLAQATPRLVSPSVLQLDFPNQGAARAMRGSGNLDVLAEALEACGIQAEVEIVG